MPARDADKRSARAHLLVGAGRRSREVAAVLATLAIDDAEGAESDGEPGLGLARKELADLEELLVQQPEAERPAEGLVILESGRVPGEDIGFVRRFLERHPGWRLIVLAEDSQEQRARALLGLARAHWLPWPPDLDQLRALLPARRELSSPALRFDALGASGRTAARARAAKRAPAAEPVNGIVDLGDLLEELLAAAALQGEGTARYQYQRGEPFPIQRERDALAEGLAGLVALARHCAGAEGLVRAAIEPTIEPNGDGLKIGLDFPLASLPEKDLPGFLERSGSGAADQALAAGVAAARHGVSVLRAAGARVELLPQKPGRVRCEVHLALPRASVKGGRGGKPEDPFA